MLSLILVTIATNYPAITGTMTSAINWTSILSILAVCLTAMATVIKIFGPSKSIKDDVLRDSEYIKEIHAENKTLKASQEEIAKTLKTSQEEIAKTLKTSQEEKAKELKFEQEVATRDAYKTKEEFREKVNNLLIEIERAKIECSNNTKSIEELKQDYRMLAQRLDELLKQILEWFST